MVNVYTFAIQNKNNMAAITREYATEMKYRILGFNDDQCSCDVCGKQELKGTYAMEDLSTGEIFRAGSVCGSKMAGWTTKELVAKYKVGEKEKLDAAKKELRESAEYIADEKALEFLNKEEDEINRQIFATDNQQKRSELHNTKRTIQSRMDYLMPSHIALTQKRKEISEKYGQKYL